MLLSSGQLYAKQTQGCAWCGLQFANKVLQMVASEAVTVAPRESILPSRLIVQEWPLAKTDLESQTTIQAKSTHDGRLHFARRRTFPERIVEPLLPILWLASFAAFIAFLYWF